MANNYDSLIQAAEQKYQLPPGILTGLIQAESGNNPQATSAQGAQGLTQIMPANDAALGVKNAYDPAQNIDAGAKLLAQNLKASKGDVIQALKMYHGGPDTSRWGPKTSAYPGKVLSNMPQPQSMTVDQADALFGAPVQTQATVSAASTAPQAMSVEDADAMFSSKRKEPVTAGQIVGEGMAQGAASILRPVRAWAADKQIQINRLMGFPDDQQVQLLQRLGMSPEHAHMLSPVGASEVNAQYAKDQAASDASNADSPLLYGTGRTLGQIAAIAPAMEAGGAVAGPLVEGVAGGLEGSSPLVANVIRAGKNFLAGNSGYAKVGDELTKVPGFGALLARLGSSSANGAVQGGIASGASAAADNQPIAQSVLQGAKFGATIGPASYVAGTGLGYLGEFGKNLLSPLTDMSAGASERAAVNRLVQKFRADGMTPQQAVDRVNAMGGQATLADAGGANVSKLGQAIASTPGQGAQTAEQALESRAAGQAGRINQAVKEATGVQGNVYDQADQLIQQRKEAAGPLYEKAFANTVTPNDKLNVQLQNPLIQQALKDGAKIAETESAAAGQPFNAQEYLNPDGSTPAAPTMKALDAAKQGLDDMLEKYRDPTTGKLNLDSQGRAIEKLRQSYVSNLDTLNPDYASARAAYAGPSQSLDAMNMGKRALSNDPEVTAKVVGNLSEGDKEFFLQGVTRALQDKINGAQDGADVTRRIFGNDLMRQKIAAAFDNPQAFQQFQQAMQAEATFAQTRNAILKGSQTASRLAAQSDMGLPGAEAALHAVQGNFGAAGTSAIRGVMNYLMRPSEKQAAIQANYLFNPQGAAQLQETLNRMQPGMAGKAFNALIQGGKNAALPAATLEGQQLYGRAREASR